MYGKIVISSKLKVLTGMHIGGSSAFSAIGAVDSQVIKDPISQKPIIPGSSLKGKMRTLLVKSFAKCGDSLPKINEDEDEIKRLFGSSEPIMPARLQFVDAFLFNPEKFSEVSVTEIKSENTINRIDLTAMPRQIERVVRGAEFEVKFIYDAVNSEEIDEDMANLAKAMKLLQLDYLGGHGTRGSGRVSFKDIKIEQIVIEDSYNKSNKEIEEIFKGVEEYELLSV